MHRPPAAAALVFATGVLTLFFLAACGSKDQQLPAEYYGLWEFKGGGGGIDGHWEEAKPGTTALLELKRESGRNIAVTRRGGTVVQSISFTSTKENTIFGEAWLIQYADEPEPFVIQYIDPDQLSISMNEYDGFGSTYRRAAP